MHDLALHHPSATSSPLKRKCDCSDAISQLLHDFSLSPRSKKLHQDYGSTSSSTGTWSSPHLSGETDGCRSWTYDSELLDESPSEAKEELPNEGYQFVTGTGKSHQSEASSETSDRKAIILYKPVNPPLFPGGPIAGSQILLNASFLSSGMMDSPCSLSGRKDDRWLHFPNDTDQMELTDLMEDAEDGNPQSEFEKRSLAVIPWVYNPPKYVESQESRFSIGAGEDMEEDNGPVMGVVQDPVNYLNGSHRFEPWRHFRVPQSHYSSAMWSH